MAQPQRIPRLSAHAGMEAKMIAARAGKMMPPDFFSYAEMETLTGVKVQEHRHILHTARSLARHIYGKEFDVVRDEGWVCLSEVGKLGKCDRELARTHRQAGRIKEVLDYVDPAALSPVEKHCWLVKLSLTATVQLVTHPKTTHQLEAGGKPPALPWDMESARNLFA